jgi:hypothetical protein
MDTTAKADPKDQAAAGEAKRFKDWWDKLTTPAKKAIVKRQERKAEKAHAKKVLKFAVAIGLPYCCPKCHRWHPSPEARLACRKSHKKQKQAVA